MRQDLLISSTLGAAHDVDIGKDLDETTGSNAPPDRSGI
jgi:hypothetical protein